MLKHILRISLVLWLALSFRAMAQDNNVKIIRHTVEPKETLMSIARKYKITPYKLIKYNPGVTENIHPGDVLNIPVDESPLPDTTATGRRYAGFKYHTVKENETVFSISKQYNTTIEDIIKVNHIEANNIKLGQIIIIPILPDPHTEIDTTRYTFYTVQPKEGKWRVAYKHGISIAELERLNPQIAGRPLKVNEELIVPKNKATVARRDDDRFIYHEVKPLETLFGLSKKYDIPQDELIRNNPELADGLKAGQIIRIPKVKKETSKEGGNGRFIYYEVKPKETIYGITKKFNVSTADLVKYNPELADGLKAGQVLRIPRPAFDFVFDIHAPFFIRIKHHIKPKDFVTNLLESGNRERDYRIAVLLPFRLEKYADSLGEKSCKRLIKDKVSNYYAGIKIAVDSLRHMGFRVQMDVYDTKGKSGELEKILLKNDLSDYDFVLGPVYPKNIEAAASALKVFNTPVVVPSYNGRNLYPHLVRTVTDSAAMANHMLAYINEMNTGDHILIIHDKYAKPTADTVAVRLGTLNKWEVRASKHGSWARDEDISRHLAASKLNRIIIVTKDQSLLANIISALDGLSTTYNLETYLITPLKALDKFDINQMASIKLHFPSPRRLWADPRVSQYIRRHYGLIDDGTIYNGFDTTMDMVLRLANAENLFEGLKKFGTTEETQRIFLYDFKPTQGFRNIASYIIRITPELELQTVD